MAKNSLPIELAARRAAANSLLLIGLAYGVAMVLFFGRAAYEHEWGQLGMQVLSGICVAPAALFLIAQDSVRRGQGIGFSTILNWLVGGLLSLSLLSGLGSLFGYLRDMVTTEDMDLWRVTMSWGSLLVLTIVVALVFLHVRALIALGRLETPRNASPTSVVAQSDFTMDKPDEPF